MTAQTTPYDETRPRNHRTLTAILTTIIKLLLFLAMQSAAVILIGHDLGLMAQFVDRLGIMYAGRLVEMAPIRDMITAPRHPYTRMLIDSLPSLDARGTLRGIPGLAPLLRELPSGCAFHPRCPMAVERCRSDKPAVREVAPDATVACHLA